MTKKIIIILILLEGFLVMGIELSSSLIIKPFFGSSLEVWTFILGITMTALAAGYFFGNYLSTKGNTLKLIYYLFFFLSISIYLMPFVSKFFFRSFSDSDVTTILLFSVPKFLFPPLFILGTISTLLVKCISNLGLDEDYSASKTYALSTIAGIISLLILAFILVEKFETNTIIYMMSFMAFSGILLLCFFLKVKPFVYILSIIYALLSIFYFSKGLEKIADVFPGNVKEIYYSDGILGQIIVLKDFSSKTKILMVNNSVQTTTDFENNGNYIHIKEIADFLIKINKTGDVMIAGLGGGSLIYELSKKTNKIDVIELDKRMIKVCEEHFYLPKSDKINYYIDDARHYININKKKYDIIVLDLSIGETIPSNVYTLETFKKMKKSLKKDGVILLNFFSKDSKQGLLAVNSLGKTIHSAGLNVKLLNKVKDSINLTSFVFFATATNKYQKYEDTLCYTLDYKSGILLKDDNSQLDIIHKDIILEQRKNYIFNYQKYFEELK